MREIFATICLAGSIQAFLLCAAVLVKKNNRGANRFLSLFMFFMAVDFFELYLVSRGLIMPPGPYRFSIIPYSLVFGPSLWMYGALMVARIDRVSRRHALLFLPFAAVFVVNIYLHSGHAYTPAQRAVIPIHLALNAGGLIFEMVFYAMTLSMIHGYHARLRAFFSDIDALKLSLFRFSLAVLIIVVLVFFVSLVMNGHEGREYKLPDIIAILVSIGLGFAIAFVAMLQPDIFRRVRLMERAMPGDGGGALPRYDKLRLSPREEEEMAEKLRRYMEEQRPYLREDLTLKDLAEELSMPAHHLSMVLNIHFRQNFYNYINSYRVEEVKRQLASRDSRDEAILSIAYGAGFNSKSTFNTMFRKFTGRTPREFREKPSL